MSKKRRVFDIDLPEGEMDKTFPAGKVSEKERRGPMAAAITENAESLREREAIQQQINEENHALAHEHIRLQNLGLITDKIPLGKIHMFKLMRDRTKGQDFELPELVASIRSIGLSNPIRVELRPDGEYELVQGYRRLSAFKQLLEETGDAETYGTIPAGILAAGDDLEMLYRKMVDENLVRKDVSFAEMAQLALYYAADPETSTHDPDKAVAKLFKSANYSKRSYIRNFIPLVDRLGEDLQFAHEIPRALGLKVATAIQEIDGTAAAIRRDIKELGQNRSVEDELSVLRTYAAVVDSHDGKLPSKEARQKTPIVDAESKAKVTFQIKRPEGAAKCVAGAGRLEVRLDRDFSALDRRKLEDAVTALLDSLA